MSDSNKKQIGGADRRLEIVDGSWMLWTAVGLTGVWLAVLLISVFAPDMVSGSEQERLPIGAFLTWVWGLVSTVAFLWSMGMLRANSQRPIWIGLTVATLGIWLVATILSIALPVFETGSDPTRIPIGAMVTPIAAALLTVLAGITARVFSNAPA